MAQTNQNQKEDLRQRRTRRRLVSALLELLEEQPFQSLSVVDICERAMVHRTTFYTHFKDKQSLLCYAIQMLLQEFDFYSPDMGGVPPMRFFWRWPTGRGLSGSSPETLPGWASGSGRGGVSRAEIGAGGRGCPASAPALSLILVFLIWDPEITAHFYAGAMVGLIHWWAEHDMPVSEETLIRHLTKSFRRPSCIPWRKADLYV